MKARSWLVGSTLVASAYVGLFISTPAHADMLLVGVYSETTAQVGDGSYKSADACGSASHADDSYPIDWDYIRCTSNYEFAEPSSSSDQPGDYTFTFHESGYGNAQASGPEYSPVFGTATSAANLVNAYSGFCYASPGAGGFGNGNYLIDEDIIGDTTVSQYDIDHGITLSVPMFSETLTVIDVFDSSSTAIASLSVSIAKLSPKPTSP